MAHSLRRRQNAYLYDLVGYHKFLGLKQKVSLSAYIEGIKNGEVAWLSRAITLVESTRPEHRVIANKLIDTLLPSTGNALRIGITGAPGVGKSTFIEAFGMHLIGRGKKVAVLAIDPSSSVSKGSILGDKTRMEQLSGAANAYIRPSANGGSLGGVAYQTRESILLCEAAGFDVVIIETVGVGQSEIEVSQLTDFFLLLMLVGAGDELQGIKRGIMEMADALVITKGDGSNLPKAKLARSEYARALHFLPPQESGWRPKVLITSAYENTGIGEVYATIEEFTGLQRSTGLFEKKRQSQKLYAFRRLLDERLRQLYFQNKGLNEKIHELERQITGGRLSPRSAINLLFLE